MLCKTVPVFVFVLAMLCSLQLWSQETGSEEPLSKEVHKIVDGFSEDNPKDAGWKNSRLPWTFRLDPKLMYIEEEKKKP